MVGERGNVVPEKIDPFEEAIERVMRRESKIFFGAVRGEGTGRHRHNGVDLFVDSGTKVQIPTQKVVLIGIVTKDDPRTKASYASMGNGLVFFVPDEKQPYFLQLCHLSPRTFKVLREHSYKIGSEITDRPGGVVVAIAGSSMAGAMPHVHASVMTVIMHGGKTYSARDFLQMHNEGAVPRKNFFAAKPPSRYGNPMSLAGYDDPMKLMEEGRLRLTSKPAPLLVAGKKEREKPLLALR